MNQKTEITESEWMALMEDDTRRSFERPPKSKTTAEFAQLWKVSCRVASRIVAERLSEGKLIRTKVGRMSYYTIGKSKNR